MLNNEFTLTIEYHGDRPAIIFIDGRSRVLISGQNFLPLKQGIHHCIICSKNIINTKYWLIKAFNPLMYIGYPLGLTLEYGIDGFFPQISFDFFISKCCRLDVKLVVRDDSLFFGRLFIRRSFDIVLSRNDVELRNIDYQPPLNNAYLIKWKIVHGLLPCLLSICYLVHMINCLSLDTITSILTFENIFYLVELVLMNKLAFFSKRKIRGKRISE